jgi:hypothetical protein
VVEQVVFGQLARNLTLEAASWSGVPENRPWG